MNIIEIFKKFPTQDDCMTYLEDVRWNGTPRCPYCGSISQTPLPKEKRYHCNSCNTSYSVTVRTIFHQTHMPLQKWLLAVSLILNAKKGISSRQLARHLEVHRNTAWRISMKIRDAMMEKEQRTLLQGIVEMDETYIGGKPRPGGGPHKRGRGTSKVPVIGMVERGEGGKVRAQVVRKHQKVTHKRISSLIREHVDIENTTMITDEFKAYKNLYKFISHQTINHSLWYSLGEIHTNSIESFWALVKRGIMGQFHKVSIKHLPKYLEEFSYRHSHRKNKDVFALTIKKGLGVA